ncbi:MAG: DNA recombination/repair protein RecA, partial [Spirochaetaceae bacterium]|nr:DNA recombination/repair protein RecA [Spirochaetaceae bacterium]
RMKIGVTYGNPETTTGGNALKFYATMRIEVRKGETIMKSADEIQGSKMNVKIVKNKVAPPFKRVELELAYGKGVSASASLLDAAVKYNIITKAGSWFSYGEEKIGQGREVAKAFLEANPDIWATVSREVKKLMFPGQVSEEPAKKAAAEEEAPVKAPKSRKKAVVEEEGITLSVNSDE